ncbi:FAD-dependent oxidoreductase [Svornostia abyssi]|uniref:FAD-dependent oxidoreductase n=1 Tax=Svornostia abyssi TaxID=2898438 RepID=A0ABY5PHE2_9ACTN|nr:FAD-dependent oxidoreductase [Parviterribacteraceae bacterium J379]
MSTVEPAARRPVLLAVDDEPAVLAAVARDLRARYGGDYRIVRATSGNEARGVLEELRRRGEAVALILSDQRMPDGDGVSLLSAARDLYPLAKRVLLTAYADTEAAIAAINAAQTDYYLLKPWDPPDERLYPTLDDLLGDWQADAALMDVSARVVGHRFNPASHEARDFLARNRVPYQWLDVDRDAEARQLLTLSGEEESRLPIVLLRDGTTLTQPTTLELADRLGIARHAELDFYDLVIVGGGPAGLAAAVYGASEGLRTVLVEREAPGGQAGQSSRIENYLGFPNGLSGSELARRALDQARRFGAEVLTVQEVVGLDARGPQRVVRLGGGDELAGHTVLVASGVSYRLLDAPGVAELTGAGVYYGAAMAEADACAEQEVVVVGGANSAGQAAVFLARRAAKVTILVRADSLEKSMSHYLIEQIEGIDNIEVRTETVVAAAHGDGRLQRLDLAAKDGTPIETIDASAMFVFIGAAPHTDWLGDRVARDPRGFVLAGADVSALDGDLRWPLARDRDPHLLESSLPGVFVAGDVRSRSIKRVASAVGEGSMAVQFIHEYLADA